MAAWLGPVLPPLVASRGLVLSDQALSAPELIEIDPPIGHRQWRYFAYRRS